MNRRLLVLMFGAACNTPMAAPPANPAGTGEALLMQVVRLETAQAGDVAKVVQQSRSDGSADSVGFKVAAQPSQNALVLSGTATQIRDAMELIARLDAKPARCR